MSDLEFFLDPICPFAWVTSRWVVEVQRLRDYEVTWRFIALSIVNEHKVGVEAWYTPEYRFGHMVGTYGLRIADQLRITEGNEAVGRWYTALGTEIHTGQRRSELRADTADRLPGFFAELLTGAGFDPALAEHWQDESHDAHLRAETELAFSRTGKDVGTPILTFHPGAPAEASYFGPVISRAPRGADALKLWDAVEVLATTSTLSELKRTIRPPLDFT